MVELGRHKGLISIINLSAQLETIEVESVKFGEPLTENADGNPEPNPKD